MKKLMQMIALIVTLLIIAFIFSGCAALYSYQRYGPERSIGLITPGKSTLSEVIKGYGAPDAVYQSGGDEIYVFKNREGRCFLGIYSDLKMNDLVIVARQGLVKEVYETSKGEGITIIGGFMVPIMSVGNAH